MHYYLPPHHRFDKGSYVYLFHNPALPRARIEIANYAGTPRQDAFAGPLDTVKIEHTHKHPCLFTITVDAFASPAIAPPDDASQWHLPAPDAHDQGNCLYRLHTIDMYLWTPADASLFLDSLTRVLQPHQLHVVRDPDATPAHSEHKNDALSSVIARLESAAIAHASRTPSVSTTHSLPGPPQAPAPASSPPTEPTTGYAPMAYNPAAPPAPEPIAHREKTPPPPDAADGTGLGSAAIQDQHAPQYTNPLQASYAPQPTSAPYMPGPPPPPPGQGFSGAPSMHRATPSASLPSAPQNPPSFAPPPGQYNGTPPPNLHRASTTITQQYANYPSSPGFPPAPQSPPAHGSLPSPGFPPQHYQPMASPPPGGYSRYSYASTTAPAPTDPQSIHQQLYRPNESEAAIVDHHGPNKHATSNVGKRVEKVEKGVGRFLKRLDKKL